ncbi:hypothetical protein MA16_Dca029052 [Dendrobium catenatum]|uniref:Uncharacterized protein n=1 Tax=Dendrobium catenatum TaxID=906689 RepID=A0A2I0VAA1_9ASPA|nr:hypothetical protein MA16_Dca029052 [Dendrobium catenatum]
MGGSLPLGRNPTMGGSSTLGRNLMMGRSPMLCRNLAMGESLVLVGDQEVVEEEFDGQRTLHSVLAWASFSSPK